MDYLQEGIHLRSLGQKDPLVEWKREGFAAFTELMHTVSQDFVRYMMHVEVVVENEPAPAQQMQYSAPEDPSASGGSAAMAAAARSGPVEDGSETPGALSLDDEPTQEPIVKSDWDKTGRNDPCPCGSGKKFKHCHGS
jgi:preprotein translocase subunit SecA